MTDNSVYVYATQIAATGSQRKHVLDPGFSVFSEDVNELARLLSKDLLKDLVTEGFVIAFPICRRHHWWVVLAKYECRN